MKAVTNVAAGRDHTAVACRDGGVMSRVGAVVRMVLSLGCLAAATLAKDHMGSRIHRGLLRGLGLGQG